MKKREAVETAGGADFPFAGHRSRLSRIASVGLTWVRRTLIAGIFAFQIWAIAYARTVPTRYFCWAPYDTFTEYTIEISGPEGLWPTEAVAHRYRMPAAGRDNRSPAHVIAALRQYEQTYGAADPVEAVVLRYRVNGGDEQSWLWPE